MPAEQVDTAENPQVQWGESKGEREEPEQGERAPVRLFIVDNWQVG